jgi:beta-lactamase regulating signal transducer with metallopeptidase domain
MRAEMETLCGQLLEATANGVYQGIVLAGLVAVVLHWLVRTNAATRHAVWFASLALLVCIIPAHFFLDPRTPGRQAPNSIPNSATERTPSLPGPLESETIPDPLTEGLPFDVRGSANGGLLFGSEVTPPARSGPLLDLPVPSNPEFAAPDLGMAAPKPNVAQPGVKEVSGLNSKTETSSDVLNHGLRWVAERWLRPARWRFESTLGFPLLVGLSILWLALAGGRLMVLLWRLHKLRELTDGASSPRPELRALFERLRSNGGAGRAVTLKISARQRSPVLLGFIHPVILLPKGLAGETDLMEVEHVLRHELAHLRRYDDWANLVQHFIHAALFFHPGVWWISKQLSLEREIACDDHVLQQGGGRRNYALILTRVASRIHQRAPLLAPGVSNTNSQLKQRISMIMNTRRNSSPSLAKGRLASIVSATALLAVLALYAGPRFVLAQTSVTPPSAALAAGGDSAVSEPSALAATREPADPAAPAILAQSDAPVAAVAGVDAGPKFKPENPAGEPPEPPEVAAPEAPAFPGVDGEPRPMPVPRVARVGKPGKTPLPPESDNDGDGSIEARLRRLEKMVKSMMQQQGGKHTRSDFYLKDGTEENFNIDQQGLDRLKEKAERQAQRAEEQAKRAQDQVKRAREFESADRAEADQRGRGEFREAYQRQIEALRKARESLGQEMEKLDKQIEKLEQERKHSEKDQQRRSEVPGRKLQAENSSPEVLEQ